jgi:predicted acetyltransferase
VDTLWLRPSDVAATLEARRYQADGALRLALSDASELAAAAVYELRSEGGAVGCARAEAAPDLTLDRAALGSIYLGGVAPSLLARAGRVAGSAEAIARADRWFASPVAPWCPEMF